MVVVTSSAPAKVIRVIDISCSVVRSILSRRRPHMTSRRWFMGAVVGAVAMAAVVRHAVAGQREGRRRVLVLDVIETMLDLNALEPHFMKAFGDGQVLKEWFANLLLYANVATVAGPYADFGTVAGAVLDMTAAAR